MDDISICLDYALEQGYTRKDHRANKICSKCFLRSIYKEKFVADYPYYCANCDENMYDFEVLTHKQPKTKNKGA